MAAVTEIFEAMDRWAPFETQMDFDNAGFLVGRGGREVGKILVALDITEEVAEEAERWGAQLIVAHHPVIFHPARQITDGTPTGRILLRLIEGGVAAEKAEEILKFIAITGSNQEVLTALEGYRGRSEVFDAGLDELNTVVKYLASFGVPETHFAVDLTIARGLDYYTGTVYETTMLDHPEIGSICSGGRYDNLAEYYTDKKLPGVGISIGLTRLFYVLGEQGYLNDGLVTSPADVLVLPMTEDLTAAISFATQLRQGGVRAQVYGEQKKFKGKMSYADKLGIPYVAFLGEDEIAQGVVKIKDMATGEQHTLSPAQAVDTVAAALAQRAQGKPIREKD